MNQNTLTGEWRLSDLTTNKDWVLELGERDQKEIIDATNFSIKSKKSLFDLKVSDFPLNKFKEKLEKAKLQGGGVEAWFRFCFVKELTC